ncbi:hypothetical protein [Desulfovibrio inopinatus]|uniref:hypothetical protein n=1 Tax=Desulfovibrio inopinatus TaxID=102109 RepID=UPI0003F5BF4B|nr:hypothetical protein [Desulfovibrio inopinatus]
MDISNFWKTGQIAPLTEGEKQVQREIDAIRRVDRSFDREPLSAPVTGLTTNLTATLSRKLSNLESALSRFSWPQSTSPWAQSRLITNSSSNGPVKATVLTASQAKPYFKYFSRGFQKDDFVNSEEARTYSFEVQRGSTIDSLSVDATESESWVDVLDDVASAINGGDSGVYAQVVSQNTAFSLGTSAPGTGYMLALSVNPSKTDQDVSLADTSGHLLADELNMREERSPITPAKLLPYSVSSTQLAKPTTYASSVFDREGDTTLDIGRYDFGISLNDTDARTSYISDVFDPEETSTVAAGTYDFSFTLGDETRTVALEIGANASWGDILRQVSGAINAEAAYALTTTGNSGPLTSYNTSFPMPGVDAELKDANIPSSTTEFSFSDGQVLDIHTVDPFLGEDFSLTDGSGGLLSTLGLTDPIYGETAHITVQAGWTWEDVLDAVSRSAMNTSDQIAGQLLDITQRSELITDHTVYFDNAISLELSLLDAKIGQRLGLDDGGSGFLSSLGLDVKQPGQDGNLFVNGEEYTSSNNVYSQDSGRVVFEVEDEFAGGLPMTVVKGINGLEAQVNDIVTAMNDLNGFLSVNTANFKSGLSSTLNDPISSNMSGLSQLGFVQSEKNKTLWVGFEKLWQGLSQYPAEARETLWDEPNGLVPALTSTIEDVRSVGLESFLIPQTTFISATRLPQTENDLAKRSRLVDLLG